MADLRDFTGLDLVGTSTASIASGDIDTNGARALILFANVTQLNGTSPSLEFIVEGKTPQGGYYPILSTGAITVAGTRVLRVHPALPDVANLKASDLLPDIIRVRAVTAGTTPVVWGSAHGEFID